MKTGRTTTGRARAATPSGQTGYRCAPMSLRKLLPALLLLGCLFAPAAQAAPDQVSVIMDDDQLLYRGDHAASRTLVTAKALGAEAVRVTVLWRTVAEGANLANAEIKRLKGAKKAKALAQRRRFRPADPRTYPTRNWDRYDNLVKQATAMGLRIYFTVTAPGPAYAHRVAPPSQRANASTYKPIPSRFRAFVTAVGRRYSGNYRDENAVRRKLPRVALWSIWNEPNQAGWLSPQWETVNGKNVPASPALYRQLFYAGRQGLAASGHGDDVVFLGETAPMGSPLRGARNGLRPVPFLRELVCVAPNNTQYTGDDAARRHCDDFAKNGPLKAFAYAHHPYTKKAAPTVAPKSNDELTMANLGLLGKLLDTLSVSSGGKIPANLPIVLTEMGYESNPPDPRNGIPLAKQAQYNQLVGVPRLQRPARQGDDAVPAARQRAADEVPGRLAAVLVHLPVGPLHARRQDQARRGRLHIPARDVPGRARHDRLLGPAALPRQRPRGRRAAVLAREVRRHDAAVRQHRRRLAAAGPAGRDGLPRPLHRHGRHARAGRGILRRLLRPGQGQDHAPVAGLEALA